jgi:hypothetical protein
VDEEDLMAPVLSTEETVVRIEEAVAELKELLTPAVAQLPKTRSKKFFPGNSNPSTEAN